MICRSILPKRASELTSTQKISVLAMGAAAVATLVLGGALLSTIPRAGYATFVLGGAGIVAIALFAVKSRAVTKNSPSKKTALEVTSSTPNAQSALETPLGQLLQTLASPALEGTYVTLNSQNYRLVKQGNRMRLQPEDAKTELIPHLNHALESFHAMKPREICERWVGTDRWVVTTDTSGTHQLREGIDGASYLQLIQSEALWDHDWTFTIEDIERFPYPDMDAEAYVKDQLRPVWQHMPTGRFLRAGDFIVTKHRKDAFDVFSTTIFFDQESAQIPEGCSQWVPLKGENRDIYDNFYFSNFQPSEQGVRAWNTMPRNSYCLMNGFYLIKRSALEGSFVRKAPDDINSLTKFTG